MRVSNMEELQGLFASYQKSVDAMMLEARQQQNEESVQLLNQLRLRLQQGPVRTLVLGVSSAGKSTLINAVSGAIVVPEGKRTTSPIPVWVYSRNPAKTPRIRIVKHEKNQLEEISCGRYNYLMDYCYTSRQAGAGTGQEQYQNLVAATVNVDAPALTDSGITLIDTPGIGVSSGDNNRVQEILKDDCEALIILFMTLQEEDTQAYFRELLMEENAPLRDLIEQDRVFLVLNNVNEYARDISVLDTRQHIRKTFDGWDCAERLYPMNVRDARICASGIYQYESLLPKGFSPEDMAHAEESLEQELVRQKIAQPQEELDRLCRNLGEMVEDLFYDPEALDKILVPIEEKLNRVCGLLKKHHEAERENIEKTDYPAPAELVQECKDAAKRRNSLAELQTWLENAKNTPMDYVRTKWPEDHYPKEVEQHLKYLLSEDESQAENFLREELVKDNGPGSIALLAARRMSDRVWMLPGQLEDFKQNPEARYWSEFVSGLSDRMKALHDCEEMDEAQKLALTECISRLPEAMQRANEIGRRALLETDGLEVTAEEKQKMLQYLIKKQTLLKNGGLRGRFERFMLWVNFSVDSLSPVVQRIIKTATASYRRAYRQSIQQEYETANQELRKILMGLTIRVDERIKEVEAEIQRQKEQARCAALAAVDEKLQSLSALVLFEKG